MRVVENQGPLAHLNNMAKGGRKKTKKNHQYDSPEEGETGCKHVMKSVSWKNCRKYFAKVVKFDDECDDCVRSDDAVAVDDDNFKMMMPGNWMCLQCCHLGCGRNSKHQHSLSHSNETRSDPHKLAVNTTDWRIWCYDCDDEVNLVTSKRLEEVVTYIKHKITGEKPANHTENKPPSPPVTSSHIQSTKSITSTVKGLSNLGNTCFFNAVLQCLCQTKELSNLLSLKHDNEIEMCLSGYKDFSCDESSQEETNHKPLTLDSVSIKLVKLEMVGMSDTILTTLNEMADTTARHVTPRPLFTQLCQKVARFKGYQQQDSHELLRNLLDAIKTDEHKRMKKGILKCFNVKDSTVNTVEEETRNQIKLYGNQALYSTTVDQLFGGYLISTIRCKQCLTASQIFEPFLDLSLPLIEDRSARGRGSKPDTAAADLPLQNTISKHQLKKQQKMKRQQAKQKRRNKIDDNVENIEMNEIGTSEQTDEASASKQTDLADLPNGYISPTCPHSSPNTSPLISPSGSPRNSPGPSRFSPPRSRPTSVCASGTFRTGSGNSNNEEYNQEEDITSISTNTQQLTFNDGPPSDQHIIETSLTPLNSSSETHDCSILSCLNQFTSTEVLTGDNKYACTQCNKTQHHQNKTEKQKTVYCEARKQLIIFSPPAILTLHLKRFQQHGLSFTKVNKHVDFNLTLDLAPYCSHLSTGIAGGQREVLYKLYGVVEHSGRLTGGHYTAYVKYRPAATAHLKFLQGTLFKEKPLVVLKERMETLLSESSSEYCKNSAAESEQEEEVTTRWYHISDAHVREVSPKQVLDCQAYILFYERVK